MGGAVTPSYVGNNYFCESGNLNSLVYSIVLDASDPLWDGEGCRSSTCRKLSSPPGMTAPWFCRQIPLTTADDIEVRICGDQPSWDEDAPVELIELYIH